MGSHRIALAGAAEQLRIPRQLSIGFVVGSTRGPQRGKWQLNEPTAKKNENRLETDWQLNEPTTIFSLKQLRVHLKTILKLANAPSEKITWSETPGPSVALCLSVAAGALV